MNVLKFSPLFALSLLYFLVFCFLKTLSLPAANDLPFLHPSVRSTGAKGARLPRRQTWEWGFSSPNLFFEHIKTGSIINRPVQHMSNNKRNNKKK